MNTLHSEKQKLKLKQKENKKLEDVQTWVVPCIHTQTHTHTYRT